MTKAGSDPFLEIEKQILDEGQAYSFGVAKLTQSVPGQMKEAYVPWERMRPTYRLKQS